ncbi:MAG: DNA repair exonuclease [Nanoarchaeota archaeon]|nr:DNA repair exonuclease [Nanoarchaeota archaeon]
MTNKICFAHLADLHLGGWREKNLTQLNFKAFQIAIEKIIESKLEFVLFSGDIFNNAIPPIELVEKVAKELMKLKKNNIPLFVIGGSHDYSNSGKSFIKLLETVGVFKDVAKWKYINKNEVELIFTKNKDLKINLAGILGKKNGLDKNIYKNLNNNTLDKNQLNIFLFHTTLNDFKPDFMNNVKTEIKSNFLPKGFDYYAGGHIHTHMEGKYDSGIISYPGPLFPNNFSELKREKPIFNICEFNFETREIKIKKEYIKLYEKETIQIEINNLNSIEAKEKIEEKISKYNIENKIILLEIFGIINGKISDINLNKIIAKLYEKGAFHILKNTYKLTTTQTTKIEIKDTENIVDIEEEIIEKTINETNQDYNNEEKKSKKIIIKNLLKLELNKQEDEKNIQYEERVSKAIEKSL